MILIADSGSTKTDWVFLDKGEHIHKYTTSGFNPYYVPGEEMVNTMEKELVPFVDHHSVRYIYYYGSGCSTEKKRFIVEEALEKVFDKASIEVYHDLLGAARGLFNDKPGIACILGTGSNSCLYDGSTIIENVPSLGYFFGDEGSGAYIGKLFFSTLLRSELPLNISEDFNKRYQLSLEEILDAVYNQPRPNRFLSSFMDFILEYREEPIIHELLYHAMDDFIQERVMKYTGYEDHMVGCTGSVGFFLQDLLREVAEQYNIKVGDIVKDPIDGLIEYHKPDLFRYIGMRHM